jgi:hypothetical protein
VAYEAALSEKVDMLKGVLRELEGELPLEGELKRIIEARVEDAAVYLKGWRRLVEKRIGSCVLELFKGVVHAVCFFSESNVWCVDVECDLTYARNEENMRPVLLDVRVHRVG